MGKCLQGGNMRKTIRIAIEDEAHKAAKSAAALQGMTLAAFIEAAIMEKIQRPAPKPARSTKKTPTK
jgi:hypothetical protein